MGKINIICLHGFTSNGDQIKKCIKKSLNINRDVELYGVDGFVELPSDQHSKYNCLSKDQRAYWIYDKNSPLSVPTWGVDSLIKEKFYFDESLNKLINIANKIERIDGIIGFSQGGMFLEKLCQMQINKTLNFDFKFAVFISTCSFDDENLKINIPSLHIYGENDSVVNPNRSIELINKFNDAIIYKHNGHHILPTNKTLKNILSEFIIKYSCFI